MQRNEPHVVGIEVVHDLICGMVLYIELLMSERGVIDVEESVFSFAWELVVFVP